MVFDVEDPHVGCRYMIKHLHNQLADITRPEIKAVIRKGTDGVDHVLKVLDIIPTEDGLVIWVT